MATKRSKVLKAPAGLTDRERREFRRIRAQLEGCGYLPIDEAILRVYLRAYASWQEAKEIVERDGLVVMTPNGSQQIHPASTIVRQQSELLKKLCQELLLSPGARKRAGVELDTAAADDDRELYGE